MDLVSGPSDMIARMHERGPQLIAALAAALLAVTGLGYLASQTIAARPEVDVTRPPYVVAPVPAEVEREVPAGRPVGVPQVDDSWVTLMARRTGIPAPAVRAYARVQLAGDAGCPVGWTTLAGIGWVESQHGTLGGRRVTHDGHSSSEILGPALDGRGTFAAIPATPGSRAWHGDVRWEHAVGPLQFLPSTWETWRTDGDGDGRTDPHDLDDAAAAAARYLCASGADLTTGEGWSAAVLTYNHAGSYVRAVHEAAATYAARSG